MKSIFKAAALYAANILTAVLVALLGLAIALVKALVMAALKRIARLATCAITIGIKFIIFIGLGLVAVQLIRNF